MGVHLLKTAENVGWVISVQKSILSSVNRKSKKKVFTFRKTILKSSMGKVFDKFLRGGNLDPRIVLQKLCQPKHVKALA